MTKISSVLLGLWLVGTAGATPFDIAPARRRLDVVAIQWASETKERHVLSEFGRERILNALIEVATITPQTSGRTVRATAHAVGAGAYTWLAQLSAPVGFGGSATETAVTALDELIIQTLEASTATPAQRQAFLKSAARQFRIMKIVTRVKVFMVRLFPSTPSMAIHKLVLTPADPALLAAASTELGRRWTSCAARLTDAESR